MPKAKAKVPIDTDILVKAATKRIVNGGPLAIPGNPFGPPGPKQLAMIDRMLSTSVSDFNAQLSTRLRAVVEGIVGRVEEKLQNNEFKSSELGFLLGVVEDKRRALDTAAVVSSANVNIQVNNYGEKSREEILADLQVVPEIKPEDVI